MKKLNGKLFTLLAGIAVCTLSQPAHAENYMIADCKIHPAPYNLQISVVSYTDGVALWGGGAGNLYFNLLPEPAAHTMEACRRLASVYLCQTDHPGDVWLPDYILIHSSGAVGDSGGFPQIFSEVPA